MPPKTTTWDTVKLKHVLLRLDDQGRVGIVEVGYEMTSTGDTEVRREKRIELPRTHTWLNQTLAQALAATSPRLFVVDALVAILMADIKVQEGL